MDIVAGTDEFQDWELLHPNSDLHNSPDSFSSVEEIGLIQPNYFSLDIRNQYVDDSDDKRSGESNNPSRIDPGSVENSSRSLNKDPGEFWSDSSSDRSDERKNSDFEAKNEMDLFQTKKKQVDFEGSHEIDEIEEKYSKNLENFYSDFDGVVVDSMKRNDTGENSEVGPEENPDSQGGTELLREEEHNNSKETIGNGSESINENGAPVNDEIEKRRVVWWKMPIEILKYCLSRVSPVRAVSVAAAVMGIVILGRSLYKMMKKSRGLEIKVTIDDKKVSQFMSRAARLNEAFSVVKRVPVIRPTLPAVGVTPWPAMSLR
ncbi:unnamed protein product [Fraxinus pennsylvanica]|uniref:DUF6821 domain-containing protein n=1 Tax=Fraxinus pennsylvanica TaxID=56036 RepID=A0AAD2DJD1_9LAMI|nr:unnamed protein product [Fraxinus pennsylvanica]